MENHWSELRKVLFLEMITPMKLEKTNPSLPSEGTSKGTQILLTFLYSNYNYWIATTVTESTNHSHLLHNPMDTLWQACEIGFRYSLSS